MVLITVETEVMKIGVSLPQVSVFVVFLPTVVITKNVMCNSFPKHLSLKGFHLELCKQTHLKVCRLFFNCLLHIAWLPA